MKRSLQEYVELVVFGLIALLVGTGLLWVVGWVLSLGGVVLKGLAGLLWMLLRFIVPVAIAGGLVYFLVKAAQGRQRADASTSGSSATPTPVDASYTPPAAGTTAGTTASTAASTTVGTAAGTAGTSTADEPATYDPAVAGPTAEDMAVGDDLAGGADVVSDAVEAGSEPLRNELTDEPGDTEPADIASEDDEDRDEA